MNLTALIDAVANRVGIIGTDLSYSTIGPMVRAAVRTIDTIPPGGWNWQRVTCTLPLTAGQEEYPFSAVATAGLSDTCRKIVEVKIAMPQIGGSGQFPLKRLSRSEADALYPYGSNMTVQCWWAEGLVLGFRPVPDAAYNTRVTFIRGEKDLALGTDSPWLPVEWQDAIVEKTAELWFRARHNLADAQICSTMFGERLKAMQAGQRPYTGAGRVNVENDGW